MNASSSTQQNQPQEPENQAQHSSTEETGHSHSEATPALPTPEEVIAELKDQLLRAMAETENTRRRARQDIENATKYGITNFARDMVGVLENLHRAADSIAALTQDNPTLQNSAEGVDLTKKELLAAFQRHGIKRLDPKGETFDPNFHQAVAHVPTADAVPGTVLDVVQAGYVIHDRLLRPAMVAVTKEVE